MRRLFIRLGQLRRQFRDDWKWRGTVTITRNDGTVTHIRNTITTAGRNLVRGGVGGEDIAIKYMAWGDNNTAPAVGDTALGNELGRLPVTLQQAGVTDGEYVTTTYISSGDAVGDDLKELGWFGGPTATATAGSGTLIARVLYTPELLNKTIGTSIQVDRTDAF